MSFTDNDIPKGTYTVSLLMPYEKFLELRTKGELKPDQYQLNKRFFYKVEYPDDEKWVKANSAVMKAIGERSKREYEIQNET